MRSRSIVKWMISLGGLAVCVAPAPRSIGAAGVASAAEARGPAASQPLHIQSDAVKAFRKTAKIVSYESDGLTLSGYLYQPQGEGPFPAIVWNHGSEKTPIGFPELGKFYTEHGFVLFLPVRSGHGKNPGPYIVDTLAEYAAHHGRDEVRKKSVALHEACNKDVVAAVRWIGKQPFVDARRIAVSGCSYGGIQTMLAAEKDLGIRACIPFAPGAMSWGNPELQSRLCAAARDARVPLFLLQSASDYSTGPSEVIGPIIQKKGGLNQAKLYPAFGTTHQEGHGGFACWEAGIAIWGDDVLAFLDKAGMRATAAPRQRDDAPLQHP